MAPRLDLHTILVNLLGTDHVYFQGPATMQMVYPCITYRRSDEKPTFANNKLYNNRTQYIVTFVSRDPDEVIRDRLKELPFCSYDRFYTADNLNHDVYKLFF